MPKSRNEFEVVIVGTGRAGSGLAAAFAESEIPVALVSRTAKRGKRGAPPVFTADHCPRGARFILLAVPDHAIAEAAQAMLAAGVIGPRSLVGHVSGCLTSSVLTPSIPADRTFSAHPLTAFPRAMAIFDQTLSGVTVMVEAPDRKTLQAVTKLFRRAGATVAVLAADRKPLYHAGAVVGTTFPFLNLMMCAKILQECGVPNPFNIAGNLLDDVTENLMVSKDLSGLTGPFARGDVDTIASNLRALEGFSKEIANLYRIQGLIIGRLAATSGRLGQEAWDAIRKVLET